jgi:AraC family transcriptional regulator
MPTELRMTSITTPQQRMIANKELDALTRLLIVATATIDSDHVTARSCIEKAVALLKGDTEGSECYPDIVSSPRGGLAPWQAQRVATYIHANIAGSIRNSDLAMLTQLSISHFSRAFKASFDETPRVYIMKLRMAQAQEMMLSTRHTLSRVALECGMSDQAHFSNLFRRMVGMSPSLWRKQFCVTTAVGVTEPHPLFRKTSWRTDSLIAPAGAVLST